MVFTLFFLGLFIAFILDIIWNNYERISKIEKNKLKFHEHYHIALELGILYLLLELFFNIKSEIIGGMAVGFVITEWSQFISIRNNKVIPGHPFAYGSNHFKLSNVMGFVLTTVLIFLYLISLYYL